MNIVKRVVAASGIILARLGLIDEVRGKRIADIAWPQFALGLARRSHRTADFVMVGIAVGPAAIAGMGFAFAYWAIARGVGFSLANGGMAFMSQRFGADDTEGLNLAFKQTLWIELVLAGAFTAVFIGIAERLIAVLGAGPEALTYGTIYLKVVALGFFFASVNQLAAKTLISANDAWTPMVVRGGGAFLNILINAVLIFGLELGVLGAALGTVISTVGICLTLSFCLLRGRLPILGAVPVRISATGPYFDRALARQILQVGVPLIGRRVVSRAAQFPMLMITANFGTIVVAAYVASREVRGLMNTPGRGFGDAGRSLVGQKLGANEEKMAMAYGWDNLRFAMAAYAFMAVMMFLFAEQIASLFTDNPAGIDAMVPFLLVMSVSLLGLGVDEASSGILSGGGDTRWPLYGRLVGLYVFMIPLAYFGVATPLGVVALYLAVTAETIVPAIVTFYRFYTGKWIAVSRQYRPTPTN